MAYPLQILHEIIYKAIHPQQLLSGAHAAVDGCAPLRQAAGEAENITISFMQQAATAADSKALQILVQTCEAGCISVANKITAYCRLVADCPASEEWKEQLQQQYRYIETQVLNSLTCLQQSFPLAFDTDQYLPDALLVATRENIAPQLQKLTAQLRNSGADAALVNILLEPASGFVYAMPVQKYSYRQTTCLQVLITELERTVNNSTSVKINDDLVQKALSLNFNDPALIEYVVNRWRLEIAEIGTLQDGLDRWALHLKNVQQVYALSAGWHAGKKDAAELLAGAVQHEITYMQSKLQTLASIYNQHTPAAPADRSGGTIYASK